RQALAVLELEMLSLVDRLHEDDRLRRLSHRSDGLLVTVVADEGDLEAPGRIPPCLGVDLRDERAGRVDHLEVALGALAVDLWRDAVGREHDQRTLWDLLLRLDEHSATGLEIAHDVDVVDDLMSHVDGRT